MKSDLLSIIEALRPKGESDAFVIERMHYSNGAGLKIVCHPAHMAAEELAEWLRYEADSLLAEIIDIRVEKAKNGIPVAHVIFSKNKLVSIFAYEAPKTGEQIYSMSDDCAFRCGEVIEGAISFASNEFRAYGGQWCCHCSSTDIEVRVMPMNELWMTTSSSERVWRFV